MAVNPPRKNRRGTQSHVRNQPADLRLAFVDEIGAGLRVLSAEKRLSHSEDAASHAIARIDDGDRRPSFPELARGGKTGQTSPGDEDGNAAHAGVDSVREVQAHV